MKVSLNKIKEYTEVDLPVEELVAKINAQLGGVEEVTDLAVKYKDAKIVKVAECEKHADADKLSVCKVDAGTGELIQIVCGASNVRAGMWAVWLPPGSTVPATHGDAEPFVLGARELRGIMSNGMLASARELGIGEDHDGIVDITEDDVPAGKILSAGAIFAEVFGLDDYTIDIENKMFTHRPDLFGQLGVAREIAGIQHKRFTSPGWYTQLQQFTSSESGLELDVFNDAGEKCPRLMAVAISNVRVKPSPLWLQCELMRLGGKPINNIVDATNLVMLLTAQPVHAYDYDKLRGGRIGARLAASGDKLTLINGKTYELSEDDIVIADGEGPVGLAGIMGGTGSEVSEGTTNIVLEVATFDMYAVRRSSMRHGLFTDATARFNKGQSPLQTDRAMRLLLDVIQMTAGGELASAVRDHTPSGLPGLSRLTVSPQFINERLGLSLFAREISALLENVEFTVESSGDDQLNITAPFWRTDIELPEDIVEEVGRLHGFDRLVRELPRRSAKPPVKNPMYQLKRRIRETLALAGGSEVLTYSFVHENILKNAGQQPEDSYKLSNSLSPELQYYRQTLSPSLLSHIHANIKAGYDSFALFELGKGHQKSLGLNDENVPPETELAAFVVSSKKPLNGDAYYQAKATLEFLLGKLGAACEYQPLSESNNGALTAVFEPKRSALVTTGGKVLGVVGEYRASVRRAFKLGEYTAGFELHTEELLVLTGRVHATYRPLSRYPGTERDICFQVEKSVTYAQVTAAAEAALSEIDLETGISPVDIYEPAAAATKNITIRLRLTSHGHTLEGAEIEAAAARVTNSVTSVTGARVV